MALLVNPSDFEFSDENDKNRGVVIDWHPGVKSTRRPRGVPKTRAKSTRRPRGAPKTRAISPGRPRGAPYPRAMRGNVAQISSRNAWTPRGDPEGHPRGAPCN